MGVEGMMSRHPAACAYTVRANQSTPFMPTPTPFLERPEEPDYVQLFQDFARVQMLITDQGPRPHLLLRRAWIELAMGDYPAAEDTAAAVLDSASHVQEAAFLRAEAWFRHVLAAAGIMHWTPGHSLPPLRGRRQHLDDAREGFAALMATDPDALERVQAIDSILDEVDHGCSVTDALEALLKP